MAVAYWDRFEQRYEPRKKPFKQTAKYYWAYGSNLNVGQMRIRCPRAQKVGPLYVTSGRLIFRMVADVVTVKSKNSVVPGGLWKITADCEKRLDQYEGVDHGLYDKRYFDIEVDGVAHACLFYRMRSRGIMPPSEGYLSTIVEGYEDFGLDLSYLNEAVEHSWSAKNKTPSLRRRYRRSGGPTLARSVPLEDYDDFDRAQKDGEEDAA